MQTITDKTSLLYVYIVDEEGISRIFKEFKQMLASQADDHTTIIYFYAENDSIFEKELEILKKRYPTKFILNPLREEVINASASLQELLEAIINSNTKYKIIFILAGDEELIYTTSNILWFLDIPKNQINIDFVR